VTSWAAAGSASRSPIREVIHELGEHLAQVPFDGPGAEEQPGADLGVGEAVPSEPGDLPPLARELLARHDHAPAHLLAGREKLAAGALGEASIPTAASISCAVRSWSRASTRRPSRRSHSP
jgi:hypothetical protein